MVQVATFNIAVSFISLQETSTSRVSWGFRKGRDA